MNSNLSDSTNLQYEVFTMANPAWASTHERIIIENRLSEFEPDLVTAFSGNNDVHWGQLGRNVLWLNSYADEYFLDLINKYHELIDKEKFPEITVVEEEEIQPSVVAERLIKNVTISAYTLALENVELIYVLQPTIATTQKSLSKREQELIGEQ